MSSEIISSFSKLINKIPADSEVLDVGGGGLGGVNTTNYLITHFGGDNVTCINDKEERVAQFILDNPDVRMIVGDFYTYRFRRKFDLIVLDMNLALNIRDWEEGVLKKRVVKLLKKGGFVINYIKPGTEQFKMLDIIQEERRQEIAWILWKNL